MFSRLNHNGAQTQLDQPLLFFMRLPLKRCNCFWQKDYSIAARIGSSAANSKFLSMEKANRVSDAMLCTTIAK
jgi:hypothetical protein